MPVQSSPPYGIYQPRVLNRWLDVNSQNGPLRRARNYVVIPSFYNYGAKSNYSIIVDKFCYSLSNNFSLLDVDIPTLPYTICISYINSDYETVRYVLSHAATERFYFDLTEYVSQRIGKVFTIEIWVNKQVNAFHTAEISLKTSILQNVDYRFGLDTMLYPNITCLTQYPYVFADTPAPIDPTGTGFGNPDADIGFGNPNADIIFGEP